LAYGDWKNFFVLIFNWYTKPTLKVKSFDFSNYLSVSGPRFASEATYKAICSPSNLNLYVGFEKDLV